MCRVRRLSRWFQNGSPTVFFEAISVGEFHEQGCRYACTTGRGTALSSPVGSSGPSKRKNLRNSSEPSASEWSPVSRRRSGPYGLVEERAYRGLRHIAARTPVSAVSSDRRS